MNTQYALGRAAANPRTHLGRISPELAAVISGYIVQYDDITVARMLQAVNVFVDQDLYCYPATTAYSHGDTANDAHLVGLLEREYCNREVPNMYDTDPDFTEAARIKYWSTAFMHELHPYRGFQPDGHYQAVTSMLEIYGVKFAHSVLVASKCMLARDNLPIFATAHSMSAAQIAEFEQLVGG